MFSYSTCHWRAWSKSPSWCRDGGIKVQPGNMHSDAGLKLSSKLWWTKWGRCGTKLLGSDLNIANTAIFQQNLTVTLGDNKFSKIAYRRKKKYWNTSWKCKTFKNHLWSQQFKIELYTFYDKMTIFDLSTQAFTCIYFLYTFHNLSSDTPSKRKQWLLYRLDSFWLMYQTSCAWAPAPVAATMQTGGRGAMLRLIS